MKNVGFVVVALAICLPAFYLFGRPFTRQVDDSDRDSRTEQPLAQTPPVDVNSPASSVPVRTVPHRIDVAALFGQETVEAIRKNPERAAALFDRFQALPAVRSQSWFGTLSPSERAAVFCSVLSYAMAPYDTSLAREFQDLLQEKQLDCDNYALLMRHFFNLLRRERNLPELTIAIVGWDGGAVGNHAQIFTTYNGRSLLIDPTVCLVAICDFDSVAAGKPVPMERIVDFSWRKALAWYGEKVAKSLHEGRYRPSDLFYYYEDFERFLHGPASFERFETPGAVRVRARVRQAAKKQPNNSAGRN